eukprot:s462_g79.t1
MPAEIAGQTRPSLAPGGGDDGGDGVGDDESEYTFETINEEEGEEEDRREPDPLVLIEGAAISWQLKVFASLENETMEDLLRGTYGTQLGLVMRLVALGAAAFCVARAWYLRHWAGSGDALGSRGRRFILPGRRGTYGTGLGLVTRLVPADAASFWLAGVALGDMDFRFVWQAWHFTLCGKRGTYGTGLGLVTRLVPADAASFCLAGVALGDIDFRFVWHASRLVASTFTLCGRRGTYGTGLGLVTRLVPADAASLCLAGVALGDMDFRFVWHAWHLVTSTFTLCGRRGTYGVGLGLVTCLVPADAASFCLACVALGDMDFRFVWQAWHLAT